jgi:predicted Zn finger-like uncharacterized protein
MAEVIIHCPQCQRPLRVTDELKNRLVKCPSCEVTFRVPADSNEPQAVTPLRPEGISASPNSSRPPEVAPGESETGFRSGQPESEDFDRAERERVRSQVQLPAICLMITGLLGILVNLLQVFYGAFGEPPAARAGVPEWMIELQQGAHGPVAIGMGFIFAAMSVLVLAGSLQMLRLRMHSFSLVGTIAAMINIGNCCCLLGLPVGIWALVVLLRPGVKAAFE